MSTNRVCLIAGSPLTVAPYVKKYMKMLDVNRIGYDVIYKESLDNRAEVPSNHHVFYYESANNIIGKIARFDKYRRHIWNVLNKNNYSKIIIFTAESTILTYHALKGKLREREYMVDIRDYSSFLDNSYLKRIFLKSLYDASVVVLSSNGFKKWLPNNIRYYTMHNLPMFSETIKKEPPKFERTICIGYLGGVGYLESNRLIADALKNDEKFSLLYAGTYPTSYNIRDYCKDNKILNAQFFGKYNEEEKSSLYEKVDIINAVYANDSLTVTTALPNKLYDAAYYRIPIVVCSGTYLAEVVNQYNLGVSIDPKKDNIKGKIENYLKAFNSDEFIEGCEKLIVESNREQIEAEEAVIRFIKS